jgi:hypothetical protein
MKNNILLPFTFAGLLLSAIPSTAQPITMSYNGQEIRVTKDTSAKLIAFNARYCEGKTYLHWDVMDQACDGLYLVYRSFDGKKYEVFGQKKGTGVPVSIPIAYYFQDENPKEGVTYYKVVHIAEDKTYLASENIYVIIDGVVFSNIQ